MLTGLVINGLISGGLYALVAVGFTLIIGVLDKLNFAHPEVLMLGGFVAVAASDLPPAAQFVVAFFCGGMFGLFIEFTSFRRFGNADSKITAGLASMAVGLILTDLTQKIWGTESVPLPIDSGWLSRRFSIAGVEFLNVQLLIVVITAALTVGLHILIHHTREGRRIQAVAESPVAATLLGINVLRVSQTVFFVSSALAAVAGLLLALRSGAASSDIGLTFGLKALAIMAIGGLGDIRGAMLGGLLIGLCEALMFHFGLGRLSELTVWLAMILTLMFRPSGLFGGGSHSMEQRA